MRLESIDLIRYGHFCGQRIELPQRQLDYYLIYGDNEAGKSTLLRGISALLFGVPTNTPDVHSCSGPELRIGGTISDAAVARMAAPKNVTAALFGESSANRFSFRRRKGVRGTLLNVNDVQIPDDSLAPFLRELDQERFEQFFGLTHDRLRAGGEELLRGKGDVGSALFQAAGLLELRQLLEKLDGDAKELSPKARTRGIGKMIEEYKQAKAEARKLAISATTVKEKRTELESAKRILEKLKEESHSLQQDLERLRRIKGNKPDLARLQDLRTALAALEDIPALPGDSRHQFDEATAALTHANGQITTLSQAIAQREKRIQDLPANNLFTGHEKEIEELNADTGSYIQSVGDRAKRLRERDDAIQIAEAGWKEIWPGPVQDAENLRNAYSGKEEILNLVAEHKGLMAKLALAKEELENVQQEQEQLQEALALHAEVADPAGLLAAIEHAKTMGETELAGARLRREIDRLTQNAQREMRSLAQWTGSLPDLQNLRSPLPATIEQYGSEWEDLTERRENLARQHAKTVEIIRERQGELESLATQVAEAGESELKEARARREQLWQLIRAAAFEKTLTRAEAQKRSGASTPLADAFAEHLQKADQIADIRFANAREVAIHDRLVKEIALAREEQQRIEAELGRYQDAGQALKKRWSNEWKDLESPLAPAEMKEWLQLRQAVLDQYTQSREKEDELHALQERVASAAAQIKSQLLALGRHNASGMESLPVLIKMAEAVAAELGQQRRTTDDLRRRLQLLSVEKRRERLQECDHRLAEWTQKWVPYVQALLLPETSTPDQVARALAVLEKVFDQLKDAARLQHRVNRIGDNIELFEKRVAQLVASLDPSYGPQPGADSQPGAPPRRHMQTPEAHAPGTPVAVLQTPDAAVKQMHWQVVELGNAEAERKTLQEQNKRDKVTLASCQEQAQAASGTLNRLMALAKSADGVPQELATIIAAAEQKLDVQQEHDRIARGLKERNAVSDLAQIEQEAAAYELDSLQSEIAIREERRKNSVDEISKAASLHGELTKEFALLETSEESALQAQKAEDAMAQLRPAVAQYLRLRLASEVLEQAIESYREKHQAPILTRASELFSRLTLSRYSGLTSDFGDDDNPVLVAIRRNDERIHVEGLSDGTRDQLYLALRLAAIEHHVETVAPCPVIFDDLLINSDDVRSSAALQVIGELAKRTQVLFFTHHKRLAELGTRAGAQMIELSSIAASAVA